MALFRMPLFFLLSGIFFSWAIKPSTFLFKKSEALLKPYFAVLLLLFFAGLILGENDWQSQLGGILYGNGDTIRWVPLWFLTHLFALYCFCFALFKLTGFANLHWPVQIATLSIFAMLGLVGIDWFWQKELSILGESYLLPGLPFSVDILLITAVFFISGYLLKQQLIHFRPSVWWCIAALLVFLFVSQFTNAYIDFNKRVYRHPLFATMATVSGIYLALSVAYFIAKSRWLRAVPIALGKGSLYILIFHVFIGVNAFNFFSDHTTQAAQHTFLAFICFALSIGLPLLIKWLVERNAILALAFLPFHSNKMVLKLQALVSGHHTAAKHRIPSADISPCPPSGKTNTQQP